VKMGMAMGAVIGAASGVLFGAFGVWQYVLL
jgi:hypothetical protein